MNTPTNTSSTLNNIGGVQHKSARNSRIELLRIFAMLLIVMHHFSVHGIFGANGEILTHGISFNLIFLQSQYIIGKIGVDIFIIISAWFVVDKKFKYNKFIKLFGEVWFYSIVILLLFLFVLDSVDNIGIKQIICSILPILTGSNWFITAYVILMLISPFLNETINKFDKKILKNILITMFILSVLINGTISKFLVDAGNNIFFFTFLYLLIGYIKKYNCLKDTSYKRNLLISAISFAVYVLSVVLLAIIGHALGDNPTILKHSGYFCRPNTIFTLITSLELFIATVKMKPFESKIINKIAGATFGVYLIHDNSLMRPYIWQTIFKCTNFANSPYLILYEICVVLIIYVVCTLIDLLREVTVEKLWLKIGNHLYNFVERPIKAFCTKMLLVIKKFKVLE